MARCARQDDGQRGANAQLHAHRLRHVENAKHLEQYWHDDRTTADPEQARKQAGGDAGNSDGRGQPEELADRVAKDHLITFEDCRDRVATVIA